MQAPSPAYRSPQPSLHAPLLPRPGLPSRVLPLSASLRHGSHGPSLPQAEGTRAAQLVAKVLARRASPGTGRGAAGALRVLDRNRQSEGGSQKGCLEQRSPTGAASEEGSWAGVLAWRWSRHPRAGWRFPSSVGGPRIRLRLRLWKGSPLPGQPAPKQGRRPRVTCRAAGSGTPWSAAV